jgi:hypothetical protein
LDLSYLKSLCYSNHAIPIFKSFWVSSPLFDSPFTCPSGYLERGKQLKEHYEARMKTRYNHLLSQQHPEMPKKQYVPGISTLYAGDQENGNKDVMNQSQQQQQPLVSRQNKTNIAQIPPQNLTISVPTSSVDSTQLLSPPGSGFVDIPTPNSALPYNDMVNISNQPSQQPIYNAKSEYTENVSILFPNNNYPIPVMLPLNLNKLFIPAKSATRPNIQFSTGNNFYFNHSFINLQSKHQQSTSSRFSRQSTTANTNQQSNSFQHIPYTTALSTHSPCVCSTILEPNISDVALIYILNTHFNTLLSEKLRSQNYKCLHSSTCCFTGQQAVQLLIQQHNIVANEKDVIGLLTRLLHLSFIVKLDVLEAHVVNNQRRNYNNNNNDDYDSNHNDNDMLGNNDDDLSYRLVCDHVHPLPSFQTSNSIIYVINFNLHQRQRRK